MYYLRLYPSYCKKTFGYEENEVRIYWNSKFGYGMNDWGTDGAPKGRQLGLGNHIPNDDVKGFVRMSQIVRPTDHIAIADSKVNNIWDFVIDPTNPLEQVNGIHQGGSMILYSDNHVIWRKASEVNSLSDEMRRK